ncbi:MAG: DUF362 domain-containing protein [Spirochaetales bacterium]|nr:DUF362 domain-containing protein [Spirochaetales bacterium]
MKVKVGLVQCNTYATEELEKALEEAMNLSGGIDVKGKKLLLKPNILSDSDPAKAISTHPEFVRAVIKYMQKAGAKEIYVGDSPAVHKSNFNGRKSGIRQVIEETGTNWIDFTKSSTVIKTKTGIRRKKFTVTSILNEVDMVISLPKIKTHQFMLYTGAVKNLFGLIPGFAKSSYHVAYMSRNNFGEMLLDLLEAVKPAYSIMDAVIGMEGPGPANGYPIPVKLILASQNTVALDITASTIIGYDPKLIPTNHFALKRDLGLKHFSDISVEGLTVDDVKINNYKLIKSKSSLSIILDFLNIRVFEKYQQKRKPKPYFIEEKCIKCGDCIDICASDANWFEQGPDGKFVAVHYDKCIRCYCCHEVCPVDAIEIRK